MAEPASWKVTLSDTTVGEEEAQAAAAVVRSGWLTQGAEVAAFEEEFAAAFGHRHAVAVSNCTIGLEIAFQGLGVGPGDEVIMPALTFVASANAAIRCGARPVFADVISADDLSVDPEDVKSKMTARTKALCPVHFAGFPVDMTRLLALTDAKGIRVIEDCAHAPGARYEGKACGAIGDIGAFSFFGNKNLTTGEGGMLTTESDEIAAQLRLLRAHGMTSTTWDRHRGHSFSYDVARVGTNARLDEIRAAIGRIQLRKLKDSNRARGERVAQYRSRLSDVPELGIPYSGTTHESAHHLFVVVLPPDRDRLQIMTHLRQQGIQSSIHYPLTTRFSAYAEMATDLPVADQLSKHLLTLPLYPTITAGQVDLVCDELRIALDTKVMTPVRTEA